MDFYKEITQQPPNKNKNPISDTYTYDSDLTVPDAIDACNNIFKQNQPPQTEKNITIPQCIHTFHKQGLITSLAEIGSIETIQTTNIQDVIKFQTAQKFVKNLKYDIWNMCMRLWQAVWQDKINNELIEYISSPEDPFDNYFVRSGISSFRIIYKLSDTTELNLPILINWQENDLRIGAEISTYDAFSPLHALINAETANIEKKYGEEAETSYNQSKFCISLAQKIAITDNQIMKLQKAAAEICDYLNTHKPELINEKN